MYNDFCGMGNLPNTNLAQNQIIYIKSKYKVRERLPFDITLLGSYLFICSASQSPLLQNSTSWWFFGPRKWLKLLSSQQKKKWWPLGIVKL